MKFGKWRIPVLFLLLRLCFCPPSGGATDPSSAPDSTVLAGEEGRSGRKTEIRFPFTPFETIDGNEFRSRHAFSLDHFLELYPGLVVGRRGPIGADSEFSRYGIGRGRGVLYLGSVSLNDPQDGRIPLALVPTTLVGGLEPTSAGEVVLPERANIEGGYRIIEPPPPTDQPAVSAELSTGDRDLRQRRVSFSSIAGPVGFDFDFDELLNDGYSFDARGNVRGRDYGKSTTRIQGGNLRGEFPGDVGYLFSFRRFTSVFDGDLVDADHEQRRDGHLAEIRSSVDGLTLSVFERSHKASVPDSATSNQTVGVQLSTLFTVGDVEVSLGAGYEDIRSRQRVRERKSQPRLEKAHLGAAGRVLLPRGVVATIEANSTHHFGMTTGWGAGGSLGRWFGSDNRVMVEVKRRFRMPNLGELFQPRHAAMMDPSTQLVGNRYVKEETALEGNVGWYTRVGVLTNQVRVTAMRVWDPIVYRPVASSGGNTRSPQNAAAEDLLLVEDRAGVGRSFFGTLFQLAGSVEYTPSERVAFFAPVPEYRVNAWGSVERSLFKETSGFRVSAEYQHGGARKSGSTDPLPSYDVLNLKLVVRLIDAHLYIQWLNVNDQRYETIWPYLMTPRTFVYGVEWTIFD